MTIPDPLAAPALNWGILGAGGIAHKFADAVNNYTTGNIVAVASASSLERAQGFVRETGSGTPYGSYEELLADPAVEAVYVATTHNNHHGPALAAIAAGKPVLVEKAFAQNGQQVRLMVDAARAQGTFLMEAMWTRHLPHVHAIREAIARGEIGEVVSVQADHGQALTHVPRLMRPELAGGALLDLGVYPVAFAHDILGAPASITAVGQLTETGVDANVAMILGYPQAQAALTTTLLSLTANRAVIGGTEGMIDAEGTFYAPTRFTLTRRDGTAWTFDGRVPNGFQYQAAEVARCVAEGRTESPVLPLESSVQIMAIMDEVRSQIGVVYPNER